MQREKYRAKNGSLRNTSTNSKGVTFVILKSYASVPVRKERLSPTSKARREAKPARWCSGESVRLVVGRPGVHSLSRIIPKDFKKWYSQLPCLALSIYKGIVWRTRRRACLLCPWARHLTGRLHLHVVDRWLSRTSPGYNCEVANPACGKRRLLSTHQWQSTLLVVGLPVTEDWFEMDCDLSPSLISIKLTA